MDPRRLSFLRTVAPPLALLAAAGLSAGFTAVGCGVFDWADDCGHNQGRPGCSGPLASGTGATGTGGHGGAGSSSSSGGGGTGGCTDAKACPAPPPGPCASLGMATCADHACGITYMAGDAPSQVYGNCQKNQCDADGGMTSIEDDDNVFQSDNPCLPYVCSAGTSSPKQLGQGTICALPGGKSGYCDAPADPSSSTPLVCAECDTSNAATTCSNGFVCVKGKCVPSSCRNKAKDTGETDTDCGGSLCLPCDTGQMCTAPADCYSNVCSTTTGTCQAPTCFDNVRNADETGVDCGGKTCPACGEKNGCVVAKDCKSGVCAPSAPGAPNTCQPPSCVDGVMNGDETGVDCGSPADGGMACPACAPGQ